MEDWKGDVLHEDVGGFTYRTPELTFRLWVFILDQQSFSTSTSIVGDVREWLAEVGGVHVYEDGIRVPYYGGSGNARIEMNLRRSRSTEGLPSNISSCGLVRLSNAEGRTDTH